ncbi:penicillin-binding transpeptidase domain-containing protein [Corynebacterium sp. 153RC1]|uniref:penicillin-binding transpeptidase domain-containing protein n=1 Tax=Corynebacterium TaxID=1716 RepID=UPI00211C32A5|nr:MULTISPECIES: penicillin-binding transpeptidase domain-containing protein [unclassified Corynebacterium]MCQ9370195.1 penicillin-binding transpeptidase domain-containing protein [Corynebacterium sp. 35RC1]MCQ9344046.1 penicillin-binding transpeptidase domain-containing protein [Corynebacterium sp. 76QC2CO]MCQ9352729.1 penicillin-binding transpeptidase domain-containing protein [Corynebacterium sp. 209RC1]MCQ9354913.1 penicillin-binding transpeptidase domain-containing protein [Corynebacterium
MNRSIRMVSIFSLLLILVLLINLTVIQAFRTEEYADNPLNRRAYLEMAQQPRGSISTAGVVLAESIQDEDGFYQRQYLNNPQIYGPVTGYLSQVYGAAGLEASYNEVLNGTDETMAVRSVWSTILGESTPVGNVELTLNPGMQQVAHDFMAESGYEGAVVAIRPSTGEILTMASSPSYNAQEIVDPNTSEATWAALNADPGSPLLNHATQEILPPGSTFKVITTAAGLAQGYTPDSQLTGANNITLPGTNTTLENYGGQVCAGQQQVSLATAFQLSCNTAFVEMGIGAGADAMRDTAAAFGVGETYNLGLPMVAGTVGDIPDDAALGQSSIGQRDVALSVLQNAVIAATVANGGLRMEPHLVARVTSPSGSTISQTEPRELTQAVSPEVAGTLTELMRASERNTAGYAGQDIASKTGTAEHGEDSRNSNPHAWYIAFSPSSDVAVAVVVKNGGSAGQAATGGSVAAPIGRAVIAAAVGSQG